MIVKRFGFAKLTEGDISTPRLVKIGEDMKFEGTTPVFLGKDVKSGILYPPSLEQREVEISENIYLIPNLNDMLRNTKELVDYTLKIRNKLGFGKIFYAPGIPPHLIPIFFYLGYDLFDDSRERMDSYSLIGKVPSGIDNFSKFILDESIRAFKFGRLRELVEGIPDNKAKEILRYLDLKYYREQERFWPIWNERLEAVSHDSLFRPDVQRWMRRLKERYRKPKYAKHLLLIPCSAKKPYSLSKTHREMKRHIKSTMHEVILTSPLGLVPRELESFYPAQNYDIPVIGHWYEEEIKMIRDMLSWYLEKFEYESIISYLPESMRFLNDILREYGAEIIWGNNLDALERETKKIDYHVPHGKILRESLGSLAAYQFNISPEYMEGIKVKGKYPRINIWNKGKRFFGYNIQKGMLTLTEESSRVLLRERKYVVWIDDFHPEGDVFAAGILNATPEIREGDEVAVAFDDELRAWGTARMCSYDMVNEKKGKAVKIRGKI
ncbi:MAG: DUF5591 domain-containing protein [Thermoplasmata archaeon]|nr:DUF5591 domain-containing protein [Thermoplasmata archaeon]